MGRMISDVTAPTAPTGRRLPLAAVGMAVPAAIFSVTALSVALGAAQSFLLTDRQTTALIVALYGIPGAVNLLLVARYRQPLLLAWHVTGMVFLVSFARDVPYAAMAGATCVAGALVLAVGALGLSARLAALVPSSVVYGTLGGAVLPYVVRIFDDLVEQPAIVGAVVVAYLLGRRLGDARVPPLLLAAGAGLLAAGLGGNLHPPAGGWVWPAPVPLRPVFTWRAILAVAPVEALLIAVQSNLASVVYLRGEGYQPPERVVQAASGLATMAGSLFGVAPISTGAFLMPLVAGPQAGEHRRRHWSVVALALALLAIAALAGMPARLPAAVPPALLFALAGLALLGVLGQALAATTRGPLRLGPLFAFVVASSHLTLFGLGPLFWSLVVGTAVSLLLEQHDPRAAHVSHHTAAPRSDASRS